nr:CHAT domain-containing tetratricopeptide repeat protein [Argonema galeatum]
MEAGRLQYRQGRVQEALETFQQVLTIRQGMGDRNGVAEILNEIGLVYENLTQYPKALEFYQQTLDIARELRDRESEGRVQINIGAVYFKLGQSPKALEFYQQALAVLTEVGDRQGVGLTLNSIGRLYRSLGQYDKALQFYQQALAIAKEIGDRETVGVTLSNIGVIYLSLGQYPKAQEFYQQALAIAREIGNKKGEETTLINLGAVYDNLGQYPKALELYQQALAIAQARGDKASIALTFNNIGLLYDNQGQYAKALEFYQQVLAIRKEIGDRKGEGNTLNSIGFVYNHLGQYAKSLEFYQQALAIRKEVGDRKGQGTTLNNIGVVYDTLGQSDKALEFHQQALAIRREIGDKSGEGKTLNNIGRVYNNLGQSDKALEFYQQALVIVKSIGDRLSIGVALNNIGTIYDGLAQYPKALDFYQQSLVIRQEIGDKPGESIILNNIGNALFKSGNLASAEKSLSAAITVLESLRPGLSDTNKVSIFETQASTYQMLQKVLIAENKIEAALEIAERGRSRAFVELLAKRLSSKETAQLTINPPTIEQIKQIAKQQNATIIEYSIIDKSELYIWVIQPTGKVEFQRVDLKFMRATGGKSPLEDLVITSRDSIGVRGRGLTVQVRSDAVSQTKQLQQLYQIIIKPIVYFLPKAPNARVIFIPQAELFLVPFPALQDASGKYLIQQHTILTAPAIQVLELTHQQRQRVSEKDVLVVGNPTMPSVPPEPGQPPQQLPSLPGAEKEALAIAQILNTKAITGNQATKATILEKLPTAKIVHLATHGLLDDFKGLGVPGAIALAPSGNDNGLLTASEILDLKLNAELVVLSACDTGRGTITGDGAIGLSRALISAGVPTVLVSLWSVPDAPTALLMTEFYQNLQTQPDKAQALRQAMLKIMKQHPNPRDWAAFTLIGEAQ